MWGGGNKRKRKKIYKHLIGNKIKKKLLSPRILAVQAQA